MADEARLRVSEIFHSLQGESRSIGWPTVFVRLAGCPLRCSYCDTPYAFSGGDYRTQAEILDRIATWQCGQVTVTGGEPLAQKGCVPLLQALVEADYRVSLETSGALDISAVDPGVSTVMDLKTPGSGEEQRNRLRNIPLLRPHDQVKFVLCDRQDYDWSKAMIDRWRLTERCEVLMSPAYGLLEGARLADWILADRLLVRFQLQLHKLLWGEERGR
jgi:7-carboxy-7-deazaguanine synthase